MPAGDSGVGGDGTVIASGHGRVWVRDEAAVDWRPFDRYLRAMVGGRERAGHSPVVSRRPRPVKRSIIVIVSIVVGWVFGTFSAVALKLVGVDIPASMAKTYSQYNTYSGAVVLVLTIFSLAGPCTRFSRGASSSGGSMTGPSSSAFRRRCATRAS
jgi:uncharacterized membrane protein YgcG